LVFQFLLKLPKGVPILNSGPLDLGKKEEGQFIFHLAKGGLFLQTIGDEACPGNVEKVKGSLRLEQEFKEWA